MPIQPAISQRRRLAASATLVATGGGIAAVAVHNVHWGLLACAGVVGAAGVGLARRSMTSQVLARGAAWCVLAPTALVAAASTTVGHPEWIAVALALGSGSALLLARPMLHSAEARAQFAPSSFRHWLLASATASASAGLFTGLFALEAMRWHASAGVALLALATALLASAVGVVRMRAWGILLGGLASVITLLVAVFLRGPEALALALATLPGFMLLAPVALAKRDRARADAARRSRVAPDVTLDETPARVRIASDSSGALDEALEECAAAAAPAAAARAQA